MITFLWDLTLVFCLLLGREYQEYKRVHSEPESSELRLLPYFVSKFQLDTKMLPLQNTHKPSFFTQSLSHLVHSRRCLT
jgi:hypothetical protein